MFKDIAEVIEKSEKIYIYPHKSVDGDCLGSAYALKLALLKLGKKAEVKYEENELDNRVIKVICDSEAYAFEPDLIIAVDCADTDRLGSREEGFKAFNNTICIDHHGTNPKYAMVNYVDGSAAAAGEIVFDLIKYLGVEIDKAIANNLYVAIASDTGGFAYSNTTPKTHKKAAELIETGIDFPYINAYLFNTNTNRELILTREALNNLEVIADGKIASVTITKDIIEKYNATDSELGGLVNYPRSLDTVKIAFYFKENNEGVKVSMRSTEADVAKIAQKFGGGGHKRASGCFIAKPLSEVKKLLYDEALVSIGG